LEEFPEAAKKAFFFGVPLGAVAIGRRRRQLRLGGRRFIKKKIAAGIG
jgi:hypothetical protein